MSRYKTNTNGYIGHSEVFTSIEAEEITGVSGSEPVLVCAKSCIETLAATATLTTAQSGATFLIGSSAATSTFTLPTSSSNTAGVIYRFVFNVAPTVDIIISASGPHLNGIRIDGSVTEVTQITNITTITFDTTGSNPAVVGDAVEVLGLDATHWYATIISGSATTADITLA